MGGFFLPFLADLWGRRLDGDLSEREERPAVRDETEASRRRGVARPLPPAAGRRERLESAAVVSFNVDILQRQSGRCEQDGGSGGQKFSSGEHVGGVVVIEERESDAKTKCHNLVLLL